VEIKKFFLLFILCFGCATQVCLYSWKEGKICFAPQTIVETKTMNSILWEDFITYLTNVQIVYLGERHGRKTDHLFQLKVAKALLERGIELAIGLEMVMRSRQKVLDRWIAGEITEEELLNQLEWEKLWGHDFSYYRDIFWFAREEKIPLIALNAPPGLVKKVANYGLNSLLPGEKEYIAKEIDLTNQEHREFVEREFERHKAFEEIKGKKFNYFYEAQCVWDETMAETIAEYLKKHPNKHLLVLTGKGHIIYKFGIPERAYRRLPTSYLTVIPISSGKIESKIGDFIYLTH